MENSDPIMEHLEDQITWYDKHSHKNQRGFNCSKVVEISAVALIPLSALYGLRWAASGLAGFALMVEMIVHQNQYQENWIEYRSTCEALKHEKYLFLGRAGPYADALDAHSLLAERIESLVSQEHAKWASIPSKKGTG